MSLVEKRAELAKARARALRHAKITFPDWNEWSKKAQARWLRNHRDTPKGCSCHMCRNPRRSRYHKSDRLTLQERKRINSDKAIE